MFMCLRLRFWASPSEARHGPRSDNAWRTLNRLHVYFSTYTSVQDANIAPFAVTTQKARMSMGECRRRPMPKATDISRIPVECCHP
jgi:hypothetical protein